MPRKNFNGMKVLALESRRGSELAKLIITYGGEPVIAPALREVPLESNHDAAAFVSSLLQNEFDMVIFLTGVGTRILANVAAGVCPRAEFGAALLRTTLVARGPKPVAALREMGVTPAITAPEPNTWREVLRAIDESAGREGLLGMRIAVQEYGLPSEELLGGLRERGAEITQVPVYQWALPEDIAPLREAIRAVVEGKIDVILFTTGVQVTHMFQVAEQMEATEVLRKGMKRTVVASIGPSTSETLRRFSLFADFEPSHPKMGFLVKEVAERCAELRAGKF